MADGVDVTPGSGTRIATRLVNGKHYQRITGDLAYFQGETHLGDRVDQSPADNGGHALSSGAAGTLISTPENCQLANASLDHGSLSTTTWVGNYAQGQGLVELVHFDVITNVKFFPYKERENCVLGAVFFSGGFTPSTAWTTGTTITLAANEQHQIRSIVMMRPVHAVEIGGVYRYTFRERTGRSRVFIPVLGSNNLQFALILTGTITWTDGTNRDAAGAGKNNMVWQAVIDRTAV